MSAELLTAVANDLDVKGFLDGFIKKFYMWSDADIGGRANFVCFRMAGTSGQRDSVLQSPDVKILVVGAPNDHVKTNQIADRIFTYFAGTDKPDFVVKLEPLASVLGPYITDNGRGIFEVNVRCYIEGY